MAIKIYIDQGHNPRDFNTGAEGNGLYEQDVTYDIGVRLGAMLSSRDEFEVRLSRNDADEVLGTNNSTSLTTRVREANEWDADVFISLHVNSAENANASGNEALTFGESATEANALAEDILTQMTLTTGLRNRGIVYRPGLYVLKETEMPAVLVEMGFISNAYDARLMSESPYLFATGIYRGILLYYGLL